MNAWARLGAVVAVIAFFAMSALLVLDVEAWNDAGMESANDMDALVDGIFTEHVLAFEVLGILLTAAMIGAMVIARPLGSTLDSENYPRPSAEELERSQAVSIVEDRQ